MKWSIRNLLNPVITRCLIYGVNPIDLEYVLKKVEAKPLTNSKVLETTWITEWEVKAEHFRKLAAQAEKNGNRCSCAAYYELICKCYYACYLINSDDIESKRTVYKKLEFYYQKRIQYADDVFEKISIPVKEEKFLPGYVHFPKQENDGKPYPCVVVFAGIGSCKEELETLSRPLVERGIAVVACDQPGTGSALFDEDLKLQGAELENGFAHIMEFIENHPKLDETRIGTYGLCMGGGYAGCAASKYSKVKCCVSLFPLYVHMVEEQAVPRWMKQGAWAAFQMGVKDPRVFEEGMQVIGEGILKSSYLLVHSQYDNWMDEKTTMEIYERAEGDKQELAIDEEPAFASSEEVMHRMPVGEQMHWVKHFAADWIVNHI